MGLSFDIIGSGERAVAIVEIPEEIDSEEKEREIAKEIMEKHKIVKSVLKKESAREGEYRTRKYKLVAGEADTEVVHKEYGYVLKLDPQKVYFSVREGTERQRVAARVGVDEIVMVMFAGAGPLPVAIAKWQPKVEKIIAVEINPDAVGYMEYNIRVNKLSHKIISVLGDVREACERWYGKCDRVVMPLPLGAESFLDVAVKCLGERGGVIHFYSWGEEPDLFSKAAELVGKNLKALKKDYEIIDKHVVLPYSPHKHKICLDIEVKGKGA